MYHALVCFRPFHHVLIVQNGENWQIIIYTNEKKHFNVIDRVQFLCIQSSEISFVVTEVLLSSVAGASVTSRCVLAGCVFMAASVAISTLVDICDTMHRTSCSP